MADENLISVGYQLVPGSKQVIEEVQQGGQKAVATNAAVGKSAEDLAGKVENSSRRQAAAHQALSKVTTEEAAKQKAAATALDSVISNTVNRPVQDQARTDRFLASMARAADPLSAALRKAQGEVSRLSGIIADGIDGEEKAAQATLSLAAAKLRLADAQRAANVAAASGEQSVGAQNALTRSIREYRDQLEPTLPIQRALYENIARINAAASVPGGISQTQRADLIKAASDEYTRQIRIVTGVTAAQDELTASVLKFRDQLNPTLPLLRAYHDELARIDAAATKAGGITTPEADALRAQAKMRFDSKVAEVDGTAGLAASAQKYLDVLDPTLPVLRAYHAELDKVTELQNAGKLSALQAADANAILSTSYDKLLQKANGFDIAEKFRDQQDPTRPVERARTETLTQITKAAAAPGGLTPVEESAAIKAANEEYEKQIKIVTGVAKSEADAAAAESAYRKQVTALVTELDPLAAAQKRYNEQVDFINHATAKGDISIAQRDSFLVASKNNLDKNIDSLNRYSAATGRGTVSAQQMHFALQQLSFQANDVATSLASGISPARTFAQQFGQVLQGFQIAGGPSNAFAAIGTGIASWATPMRVAGVGLVALGAGFTALLVRASSNAEQLRQFNLILDGTGKSSLTTAANLQKTVRELRDLGVGKADAEAETSAIARNPSLNPAQSTRIAATGLDVAFRLGVKDVDGIKAWTEAINGGVDSLIALGFRMEALSVPEATYVRGLQRLGEPIKASNELITIITKNIDGDHKKSLTDAAGAVNSLESAWRKFFDTLTDTGPLVEFNKFLKKSLEGWSDVFSGKSALFDGAVGRSIMGLNSGIRSTVGLGNTSSTSTEPAVDWRAQRNAAIPGAQSYPSTTATSASEAGTSATTVTTGAIASASKAFTVTGNAPLANVDPELVDTFEKTLIETGMKAVITSSTGGSHAFGSQHYARNTITGKGEALDYNLLDATGNPILHSDAHTPGTAAYDAYVKFGEAFKNLSPGKGRSGMDFSQVDPGHVDFGLLSGAPAGRTAAATSDVALRTPAQTEAAKKAQDDLNQSVADATRNAKFYGVQQQANTAYTEAYRQAIAAQEPEWVAQQRGQSKYNEALSLGSIELQKNIAIEEMQITASGKVAAASKVSEAAGYRAAAAEEARIEVTQRGIGSIPETTERKLRESAGSAIRSSAQQAAAAVPQLTALDKLASATLRGTAAAHEQELQNEAVLRTQDALAKAEASGVPGLITLAKAETDVALAQAKRADKARESIAAAEAANENKLTLARTQLQTTLTPTGATSEEIQRQVDYLTIAQNLANKYATASEDTRKAYTDTAIAIADANVALEKAQREQQRWNDLVSSLANTIDSELTKSIEDAFSGDKVDSWGKRLQKWIGTATSQLSSSLFVKPALGTIAGALGFGTAAQSLGSFDNLFGSSTSGGGAGGTSGGVSVEKSNDGTVTIKGLEATTSLTNSLLGTSSGGIFNNLGTSSNTVTSSNDNIYGTLSGAGSKSLFNSTDSFVGTLSGSSTSGTVGNSLSSTGSSLFSLDTLKGVGAGFGAGTVLNSLIGGNKTTGTVGSGAGSLAGTLLGTAVGFPVAGGIVGGLLGGLGGLFGTTSKPSNSTGVSIDLSSGKTSGYSSSGSATNDKTLKEVSDALTKFTTSLQSSTGGTTSGYVNPQATDKGLKLDYNIPGFGAGTYNTQDSQEAIDNAELAITKGLTGVSELTKLVIDKYSGNIDDLKTALDAASTYKDTTVTGTVSAVISKTTDPSKLADALKFAGTYDKINDAAKDLFASIPSDLKVTGTFSKAKDDIKTTFDDIVDTAKSFSLDIGPVNSAREEANKRLKDDFNRNINDLVEAATDPLQSLVDIEKRAGDARVKEAEAVAGDIEAVNKLNAKNLDKIWTDQTKSIQDLRDEFKTGDLSGLTDYQRLPAARTKYVDTLAAVQGGDTTKWDELITDAKNLFSLSKSAYGEGPKTAEWRTAITAVLDNVLAGRTFAGGTKSTPPGTVLVGEKGPELISQPGGLHVYTHHETQKILAAMPETHGYAAPQEDRFTRKPNVISLAVAREGIAATGSFASGVKSTPPGTVLVGEKGPELISQPGGLHVYTHHETQKILATTGSFAGGTKATPPGTILVGEKGPELISQPGGLHVYTHHETQKILAAMPETHGYATSQEDRVARTPNVISLARAREGIATTGSFASGVKSTPTGTILVGEKGPELIAQPGAMQARVPPAAAATAALMAAASSNVVSLSANRGFWRGTSGQYSDSDTGLINRAFWAGTSGQYDFMMPKLNTNVVSTPKIMGFVDGTSEQDTGLINRGFWQGTSGQYGSVMPETGRNIISLSANRAFWQGTSGQYGSVMPETNSNSVSLSSNRGFWQGTSGQYDLMMPETKTHVISTPKIMEFAEGTSEPDLGPIAPQTFAPPVAATATLMTAASDNVVPISSTRGFWQGTSGQYGSVMPETNSNIVSMPANRGFWTGTSGQYDSAMPETIGNVISMPNIMGFADGTSGQDAGLIAPPTFTASFSRGKEPPDNRDNEEVTKLLKDVVTAVTINNNIARRGHYETGTKLDTQIDELRKPAPYQPQRRAV